MKKFKRFTVALLFACVVVGGAALTACSDGEGGNGVSTGDIYEIIKDEETWDKAFEEMEWVNFSCRASGASDYGNGEFVAYNNQAEMSETAVHWQIGDSLEGYSVKNSDGTFTTYRKYSQEKNFTLLNDTSDSYYEGIKLELVLQVSYANYFDRFIFDKNTKLFTCADEIEAVAKIITPGGVIEEATLLCKNNIIKTSKNKIIYIKSDYRVKDDDGVQNARFEYYDIGSTTVTVPQVVIDNAVSEGRNNQEID